MLRDIRMVPETRIYHCASATPIRPRPTQSDDPGCALLLDCEIYDKELMAMREVPARLLAFSLPHALPSVAVLRPTDRSAAVPGTCPTVPAPRSTTPPSHPLDRIDRICHPAAHLGPVPRTVHPRLARYTTPFP